MIKRIAIEEEGQDLVEYLLIVCVIAMACVFFLGMFHDSTRGIWTTANNTISDASTAANGG